MIGFDDSLKIRDVENILEYRKWSDKIPFIEFPHGWAISVIPPFAGAMCRFRVRTNNKQYSVYLDCHDRLGCVGSPYWEVYPVDEDVARFDIDDVAGLIKCISEESIND